MRRNEKKERAPHAIRKAENADVSFLQAIGDVSRAGVLQGVGEMQERAAPLLQGNVIPVCGGVVKYDTPLRPYIARRGKERGGHPEFSESGVAAESRSGPRQRTLRLFGKVFLGSILDIAARRAG